MLKNRPGSEDEEEYSEYSTTSSTNDSFFLNYMKSSGKLNYTSCHFIHNIHYLLLQSKTILEYFQEIFFISSVQLFNL